MPLTKVSLCGYHVTSHMTCVIGRGASFKTSSSEDQKQTECCRKSKEKEGICRWTGKES